MNEISQEINPLFQAGLEFQTTFNNLNWPFCFIGGLAIIRWGEIRMTQDIDLCLLCGFGNEERYIKTLLKKYKSRIKDAHDFALKHRVLLLYASNEVSVDISLSGLPFEDEMIRRATLFSFHPNCSLITCSAEDLIILKAEVIFNYMIRHSSIGLFLDRIYKINMVKTPRRGNSPGRRALPGQWPGNSSRCACEVQ